MRQYIRTAVSLLRRACHGLGFLALAVSMMTSAVPKVVLAASPPTTSRPNILFVILDDVGIDQMKAFGYGGLTPPKTPAIDSLAQAGVRFRNVWSMPECSPSRAVFFTGRYPLRTNIFQAIGPSDLANSQVSPYEMTAPRVLKSRGYTSAMFGKFHLAGPENSPYGNGTPASVGFDYFYGYIGGLPASIDTTAGGVAPAGTYSCGFVTDQTPGACRYPNGKCQKTSRKDYPGKRCMEHGGIFVPNETCSGSEDVALDFAKENSYYASMVVSNQVDGAVVEQPPTDLRSRKYRSTLEVDAAKKWIKSRSSRTPWMATVSFSADHTPIQCPPDKLLSSDSRTLNNSLDCSNSVQQRSVSDRMIEAMDTEFGRLLVETRMARRGQNGALSLTNAGKRTMIIVVGDNGSLGTVVKLPFDPSRAKGTVYQTGVWVPLIVAGPFVAQPNRDVDHMINIADVFELFGEIAGADVHTLVPRRIDSQSMLPYLTNPAQSSIRTENFTQFGRNLQANPFGNGPCIFSGTSCSQTPVTKSVCEDNGGVWWGVGADDPSTAGVGSAGVNNCCEVNKYLYNAGQPVVSILPSGAAMRNDTYKLVRNSILDYDSGTDSCVTINSVEFYRIDQDKRNPLLDKSGKELPTGALNSEQQTNYDSLSSSLDATLASAPACPGDGNIDGFVNLADIDGYNFFIQKNGQNLDKDTAFTSSVFDFNLDGQTDANDLAIIQQNLGTTCP